MCKHKSLEVLSMKKFLALLLSCLLLHSLVACAATEEESNDNNNGVEDPVDDEMTYGNLKYAVNEDGYYSITGYIPNGVEPVKIKIPATIEGREVKGIADGAFLGSTYISSVEFEADAKNGQIYVNTIGSAAFWGCTSLTAITIPASVTTIKDMAFQNCTALTTVTFANGSAIKAIEPHTFAGCSALTSVALPATVTTIGTGAFMGCAALTTFSIPDAVTSIGDVAFSNCESLVELSVPATYESITKGQEVYMNCDQNLQFVTRTPATEG